MKRRRMEGAKRRTSGRRLRPRRWRNEIKQRLVLNKFCKK
jgi:hypothetical protein